MVAEIKTGGVKKITSGPDTFEFDVPSVRDQIAAEEYNKPKRKRMGYIHTYMTRRG